MADLVKVLHDLGDLYEKNIKELLNEFERKNIDKILLIGIDTNTGEIEVKKVDADTMRGRLYYRKLGSGTSATNFYPFFLGCPKNKDSGSANIITANEFEKDLKRTIRNMKKVAPKDKEKAIEEIERHIDVSALKKAINETSEELLKCNKGETIYIAVLIDGKTFYEMFPELVDEYVEESFVTKVNRKTKASRKMEFFGDCYIEGEGRRIGYDSGMNFCSVNEMPNSLEWVKYRLLPLTKDAARKVALGFDMVFEDRKFRFSLFGGNYVLIPSVFEKDPRKRKAFYDRVQELSRESDATIDEKIRIERRLERLAKEFEKNVLFTFIFWKKDKNAMVLYQTIEDVSPSRIVKAKKLMDKYNAFYYPSKVHPEAFFLKKYMDDSLFWANVVFGNKKISHEKNVYEMIANVIRYGKNDEKKAKTQKKGNGKKDEDTRFLSKIITGYYKEDVDFEKHERLVSFLHELGATSFEKINLYKERSVMERIGERLFSDYAKESFEYVDVLKKRKAREFYVLGAFSRFVINWQLGSERRSSFANFLNFIGEVTPSNADRIFRKLYGATRKFGMHGKDYDDLSELYTNVKKEVRKEDKISNDEATIAFVMGSVDYKRYKDLEGKEKQNIEEGVEDE